ncbi:MAG: 4-(cytidine 5'-diphospho)-2-C-methyl-D-erythritol kinase [Chloroflexota bacterium]
MKSLRASAPAKVNLALAVTGRRADGYHSLRSVFLRLALHDDLAAEVVSDAEHDTLEVLGDADMPLEGNLVLRAVADLRAASDEPLARLRFVLTKRIPVAAGLGGGSSDGAAAVKLALAAWGVRLHPAARLGAAMRLGADVPFFASEHDAALAQGVGESLGPLPAPSPAAGIVLITAPRRLSTARVFAELDRSDREGSATDSIDALVASMRNGLDGPGLSAMASQLRDANDLWAPASRLSPDLAALREALELDLGRPLLLSGSGPTLFAIYHSGDAAADAAARISRGRASYLEGAAINATTTSTIGESP